MKFSLNDGWLFSVDFTDEHRDPFFDDSGFERVRLPHTPVVTPFNCFDESVYQLVMTYRRRIAVDTVYPDQAVRLTFEGAAHAAEVFLDGEKIGEHFGGYTAFTLDLTGLITPGTEHLLVVKLDSRESLNIPPFGHVIDYMTYAGLYREVFLEVTRPCYIEDIFIRTEQVLEEKKRIRIEGRIGSAGSNTDEDCAEHAETTGHSARFSLLKEDGTLVAVLGEISFTGTSFSPVFTVSGGELWSLDKPRLYRLRVELENDEAYETRFGFREIDLRTDGFFLNGEPVKIRGLNRHQSYPYVGYAMPASPQRLDADILKYELGLNAVRTSHYPQSRHFIDRCDEIGLLVFTEMPGWQHIGDDVWKDHAARHVEEMVLQYRNHPSIFMWGVRINESPDDHDLYMRTNALARHLDPDRPTGGVRYIKHSELLEDVYTYNDFSHTGDNDGIERKKAVTSRQGAPYLVSEYNGHMFPAKAFDDEGHRLSHALRHARVLDGIYGSSDVLGGFGWCMFDYNTHKDFGSGDRICYHGVMDMFRNPKPAAAVYASQQEETPVLQVSSSMDVGEYPGSIRGEVYAFTNAEEIHLYKNGRFISSTTRKTTNAFPNLPNGPLVIDDFLGDSLNEETALSPRARRILKKILLLIAKYGPAHLPLRALILGGFFMLRYRLRRNDIASYYTRYIGDWGQEATVYRFDALKGGRVVGEEEKRAMRNVRIEVRTDRTTLIEHDTYDVASIRIRALSDSGNLLSYMMEPVILECEGPVEILGPSLLTLRGGMTGTYVRSCGTAGSATLRILLPGRDTREVHFEIAIGEATR